MGCYASKPAVPWASAGLPEHVQPVAQSTIGTEQLRTVGTEQLRADDPHPIFGPSVKADAFDRIDVNSSGTISKEEFLAAALPSGLPISKLLEAWEAIVEQESASAMPKYGLMTARHANYLDLEPTATKHTYAAIRAKLVDMDNMFGTKATVSTAAYGRGTQNKNKKR